MRAVFTEQPHLLMCLLIYDRVHLIMHLQTAASWFRRWTRGRMCTATGTGRVDRRTERLVQAMGGHTRREGKGVGAGVLVWVRVQGGGWVGVGMGVGV